MPLFAHPVPTLAGQRVVLSPLQRSEGDDFSALVRRNGEWLARFGAQDPAGALAPATWCSALRESRSAARRGTAYSWALRQGSSSHQPVRGQVMLSAVQAKVSRQASLGYWIDEELTRRGLATEAAELALNFAFGRLRLHRVEAVVHPDNAPSLALLHRLGFREEGIRRGALLVGGAWRDHLVLGRLVEDGPVRG